MDAASPGLPHLLVSVRSVAEARVAVAGGATIIDVKEPSRGSLGMADPAVIASVRDFVATATDGTSPLPVSAALGEVTDWLADPAPPPLPAGLHFAKLGLSGLAGRREWPSRWRDVRRRFEEIAPARFRWVAVAYADWQPVEAPPPEAVIDAAAEAGCAAVLFDTFRKSGGGLLDALPPQRLAVLVESIRCRRMSAALAGSLRPADLPHLAALRPQIIAIRGAACRHRDRGGDLCADAIRAFRAAMSRTLTS